MHDPIHERLILVKRTFPWSDDERTLEMIRKIKQRRKLRDQENSQ